MVFKLPQSALLKIIMACINCMVGDVASFIVGYMEPLLTVERIMILTGDITGFTIVIPKPRWAYYPRHNYQSPYDCWGKCLGYERWDDGWCDGSGYICGCDVWESIDLEFVGSTYNRRLNWNKRKGTNRQSRADKEQRKSTRKPSRYLRDECVLHTRI
jgi:hypothetical protein